MLEKPGAEGKSTAVGMPAKAEALAIAGTTDMSTTVTASAK